MFPVIIAGCVMMTEVGFWRLQKSELQSTADMAAIAAGYEFIIDNNKNRSTLAALADANDNKFKPDMGNLLVKVPPDRGNYQGDDSALQVDLKQEIPYFIAGMFMKNELHVNVSAVVRFGGSTGEACILSLRQSGTGISAGGNVDVTLNGCNLHSNSTSPNSVNGFGSLTLTTDCITSSGGVSFTGESLTMSECSAPRENTRPIVDPYADLDVPAGINSTPCNNSSTTGKGNNRRTVLPSPGANGIVRICDNKIDLRGTVNLPPGTYVFEGTELNFGNNAALVGDDVTLIFMNDGEISSLNGNNTLDINAPSTGDYAGVAIYGDRNTMSNNTWDFQGNADVSIGGAIYIPTLDIDYAGGAGPNATACTQLVANYVEFRGNSGFSANCDGWGTRPIVGGAYTKVVLVE